MKQMRPPAIQADNPGSLLTEVNTWAWHLGHWTSMELEPKATANTIGTNLKMESKLIVKDSILM